MPAGRNKIGDIIPAKAIKSIWSYSTLPIQVTETTRNEYNVSLPKNMPQEPFVIKLEVKDAQKTQDKYREALT